MGRAQFSRLSSKAGSRVRMRLRSFRNHGRNFYCRGSSLLPEFVAETLTASPTARTMKRSFDPAVLEMMDQPQPLSAELERDLERIRQLNRWFGSYRLVLSFIRRWIKPGARMRIVDVATGSGDIPRLIIDYSRSISAVVEIEALDRQSATLEIAKKLSANYPEISYVDQDILKWNPPEPYDAALCTLTLHHFSDEDAVKVLRLCSELATKFVLVSDLRRGFFLKTGVYILTAFLFREPMTHYDAR